MLARDPQAMRARIRSRKAERDAASRQASLLSDLAVIREYLDNLKLLGTRWQTARGREHGPSVQNVAGINRLVTTLRGLHAEVEALQAAGNPLAVVTRLREAVTWVEGLPIHAGMTLTANGKNVMVRDVVPGGQALNARRTDTGNSEWVETAALATVRDVLPTAKEEAYGEETVMWLPQALQDRILGADVKAEPVAVMPLVEAAPVVDVAPVMEVIPPAPVLDAAPVVVAPARPAPAAQRPPVGLRYGLTVAAGVSASGQVYAIQGDTLIPGEVPGCASVVLEFRGERDVRLVILVLPDEQGRARTRDLLRRNDPRLRARVNGLLSSF